MGQDGWRLFWRVVDRIAAVGGCIGVLAPAFGFVFGVFRENPVVPLMIFAAAASLLAVSFIIEGWVKERESSDHIDRVRREHAHRIEEISRHYGEILKKLHDICHQIRDFVIGADGTRPATNREGKELKSAFVNLLSEVTNEAKVVFEKLTGSTCSACIKLFLAGEEAPQIQTVVRDSESRMARGGPRDSEKIDIDKNSAFREIYHGKARYFMKGKLLESCKKGEFDNQHADFPEFYDSTLVLPIRVYDGETDYRILGFLCVDSPDSEAFFETDESKGYILSMAGGAVADPLYIACDIFHYYLARQTGE